MTSAKMLKVLKECKKDLNKVYTNYDLPKHNFITSCIGCSIDGKYVLEIKENHSATLYRVAKKQTTIISGSSYEALLFALTYQVCFERLSKLHLKEKEK